MSHHLPNWLLPGSQSGGSPPNWLTGGSPPDWPDWLKPGDQPETNTLTALGFTESGETDPSSDFPPPYLHTKGQKASQANYIDYVRWKRKELENLLNRYRQGYPKQIEAFKTAAYGALPEKQKDMWGGMYANLAKRGLNESGSFLGGAKVDLENWLSGEKSNIESTAQGMEQSAQQAMLAALGKPDYANLYQQWNNYDQMLNDAWYKNWASDVKGDSR